jgi:GNAT superfamily N-acetyltransferase
VVFLDSKILRKTRKGICTKMNTRPDQQTLLYDLSIKKAEPKESELLIKTRVDFCLEDHPIDDEEKVKAFELSVRQYLQQAQQENRYIGYLGFIKNELCCGAGLLIYNLPPLPLVFHRKHGHVLNFFVYPKFRRNGIGDRLMKYIIADTQKSGFEKLVLNATEAGEKVYVKNGFKDPLLRNLVLDINQSEGE